MNKKLDLSINIANIVSRFLLALTVTVQIRMPKLLQSWSKTDPETDPKADLKFPNWTKPLQTLTQFWSNTDRISQTDPALLQKLFQHL